MPRDLEKIRLGQQNYGAPAAQVKSAMGELLRTADFAGLRPDALMCYFDKLIGSGLPRVMHKDLSLQDLQALSPDEVKGAVILLIRDFLRRYRDRLHADGIVANGIYDWEWVEMFTVRLLEASDTPVEPYVQWTTQHSAAGEEDSHALVTGLARQLRMDSKTLWDFHLAMCGVVEEDVLNIAKALPVAASAQASTDVAGMSARGIEPSDQQRPPGRESPLRRLLASLAGVAVAVAIVAGNEYVGSRVFPVPTTLDMHNTAAVNAFIASLPVTALLVVLFG